MSCRRGPDIPRHAITSRVCASGSMGNPSRWMSNRTRCTCCRLVHGGAPDSVRMRTRGRSSTSRTIRSASRRLDAHVAGLGRTRIHVRSLSNRNVCILSPCQFSFRHILYHNPHRHSLQTVNLLSGVATWLFSRLRNRLSAHRHSSQTMKLMVCRTGVRAGRF